METLEIREGFSFRGFGGNDRWETWQGVIGADVESGRDLGFLSTFLYCWWVPDIY